jgi:hypothetical protein
MDKAEILRRAKASRANDPAIQANVTQYFEHAQGVLDELHAVGCPSESVGGLRDDYEKSGLPYTAAIPVLAKWLDMVDYEPLQEDIARTLAVPWATPAMPSLLAFFRSLPAGQTTSVDLRWTVGLAISIAAAADSIDQLLDLARNRSYGEARSEIVRALGRFPRDERVFPTLLDLLQDPDIDGAAIEALGKLGDSRATEAIESFLIHPHPWVRNAAKKALARIVRQVGKGRAQ